MYNEYSSHQEHIHMDATRWETLTDLTKWLGREALCQVDETPKGWYIQYIDRSRNHSPVTGTREKRSKTLSMKRKVPFTKEQVRRRSGRERAKGTCFLWK